LIKKIEINNCDRKYFEKKIAEIFIQTKNETQNIYKNQKLILATLVYNVWIPPGAKQS
jgi:hypothetical protein